MEERGHDAEGKCAVNLVTQEDRRKLLEGQKAERAYVFENLERGRETVDYTVNNGLLYRTQISGGEASEVSL